MTEKTKSNKWYVIYNNEMVENLLVGGATMLSQQEDTLPFEATARQWCDVSLIAANQTFIPRCTCAVAADQNYFTSFSCAKLHPRHCLFSTRQMCVCVCVSGAFFSFFLLLFTTLHLYIYKYIVAADVCVRCVAQCSHLSIAFVISAAIAHCLSQNDNYCRCN